MDAASIVSSFVPPKGAVRLDSAPAGLSKPMSVPSSQNLVGKTAYWQASGSPQDVLAWEKAHLPSRFTWSGGGTSFGTGPAQASETFTLPAVPGVLPTRTLELTAAPDGGHTAIRVDAQVSWLPPKPSSERIPASAHAVALTANLGMDATSKPPAPVTITSAATVNRLASLINGLPPFPSGTMHCGMDTGQSVTLTFTAGKGSAALAVAKVAVGGCLGVYLTVSGKAQPALDGRTGVSQQVLSIAGVHWPALGPAGGTSVPGGGTPKAG